MSEPVSFADQAEIVEFWVNEWNRLLTELELAITAGKPPSELLRLLRQEMLAQRRVEKEHAALLRIR